MAKRAFSHANIPQKADDYYGYAKSVLLVNVELILPEGMRLSLAIQSAVLGLNRHNRNPTVGKKRGFCLSTETATKSVAVIEQPIKL